jgi:hypothetical protein
VSPSLTADGERRGRRRHRCRHRATDGQTGRIEEIATDKGVAVVLFAASGRRSGVVRGQRARNRPDTSSNHWIRNVER